MKITIERLENGFILTRPHPTMDRDMQMVFKVSDDENIFSDKSSCEEVVSMFYEALDGLGEVWSDYDNFAIEMHVKENKK